jgi:dTMP kinase
LAQRGIFITFEGPEGSGKSTQVKLLSEYLLAQNYPVVTTREPGGTPIGDEIRAVLMGLKNTSMRPRTELLLFQASRAQLVEEVINPHLKRGDLILCDRYADSTLAYQGYGYQLFPIEKLRTLIAFATGGLTPDLTLLLDVDAKLGLQRRMEHGEWTRMDAYDCAFHQRVRQGYLEMATAEPDRWVVIDASLPPDSVQEQIRKAVMNWLMKAGLANQA